MEKIKDYKQYQAIMARIDELLFDTDENTPADDPRLQELEALSDLVVEYEKEHEWTDEEIDDLIASYRLKKNKQ